MVVLHEGDSSDKPGPVNLLERVATFGPTPGVVRESADLAERRSRWAGSVKRLPGRGRCEPEAVFPHWLRRAWQREWPHLRRVGPNWATFEDQEGPRHE